MDCEVLVIGGGVVGLACAAELSRTKSVVLVEWQPKFGQDTSSRNSEVIHSGIYYSKDSLKTRLCIEGRDRLYDFCKTYSVPYQACGKLLVATETGEEGYLDKVQAHCQSLDVPCERWSGEQVNAIAPWVSCVSALHLSQTGIVDSHALMATLERLITERGGIIAYHHRAERFEQDSEGWKSELISKDGRLSLTSQAVINCAGLAAAGIANQVSGTPRYTHRYCRGRYFGLSGRWSGKFEKLVYPVPPKDGLGVHITLSLDGSVRLGPDVDWTDETQYEQSFSLYEEAWSDTLRRDFATAARRYTPAIAEADLVPGFVGVRPKLFVDGKAHPDFLFENWNGFISCLGIESPGLTASLAIANRVSNSAN